MTITPNGKIHLLLAGQSNQVQAWAGWFALKEQFLTSTAVSPATLAQSLGSTDAALVDATLLKPQELLALIGGVGAQGNIHVVLPHLAAEQAIRMEAALNRLPAVRGIHRVDVSLAQLVERIQADTHRLRVSATVVDRAADQSDKLVLAVWNGAGGVGKTTLATNLSYEIAQRGKRTLLLNLDAPDDAALMLGLRAEPNIAHWRTDPTPQNLRSLIQQRGPLYVLAGFRDVFAQAEAIETPADQAGSVRQFVEQAQNDYEVIILDTPQSPIAAHVLAVSDQLVLVARPGLADAERAAVAYRTVVDRLAKGVSPEAVHVVINRLHAGHRLNTEEWHRAASSSLGRVFPPIVAMIDDDVRIGDAQDRRRIPVAEITSLRKSLAPLIQTVLPSAAGQDAVIRQFGPFEIVQ